MAFNGIFPEQELVPAAFGVLSVADVVTPEDDSWIRGFAAQFLSRPQVVRILSKYNGPVDNGTVYTPDDDLDRKSYEDIDPFFIEVESKLGAFNTIGSDFRGKLLKQIEAVTQKAIEYELWTGVAAIDDGSEQSYLTKNTSTVITTGGVTPKKALSIIEGAIAQSPTGTGGVIHMTRELGSILSLQGAIKPVDNPDGTQHLETVLGTKIIIGSGYEGTGPNAAAPAANTTWIYATGPVSVLLGDSEVVNEDDARSFTPSTNDVFIKAIRAASVYFDPSIFYAAQVTLPDAP